MNSEGGNHAGSNSDIPRDSPREAQTEGKSEQLSNKTDKLCRSESTAGSESFTERYVAKLDEQKALRTLSAGVDSMSSSDVININIGDNIQVAGANIRDRQPHRHTFPIKTSAGNTHWHWIDATVQMSTDGRGLKLQIHGLSANSPEDSSKTASHKWTPVNLQFDLWRNSQTQHIPAREFHDFVLPSGEQRLRRQNEPSWTSHPEKYNRISVNEKL